MMNNEPLISALCSNWIEAGPTVSDIFSHFDILISRYLHPARRRNAPEDLSLKDETGGTLNTGSQRSLENLGGQVRVQITPFRWCADVS